MWRFCHALEQGLDQNGIPLQGGANLVQVREKPNPFPVLDGLDVGQGRPIQSSVELLGDSRRLLSFLVVVCDLERVAPCS